MVSNYCTEILSAIENIKYEQSMTGIVSSQAITRLVATLEGDLFMAFFVLSVIVEAALLALTVVTNVFSFLVVIVGTIALGIIVNQALNAGSAPRAHVDVNDGLVRSVAKDGTVTASGCQTIRSSTGVNEMSGSGIGFGIIDVAISQWVLKMQAGVFLVAKSAMGKVSLAMGGIALALSVYGVSTQNDDVSRLAFDIGIAGLIFDAIEIIHSKMKNPLASITMGTAALGLNLGSMCVSYLTLENCS